MIPLAWYNRKSECDPKSHWDTAWLQAVFAGRVGSPGEPFGESLSPWDDAWFGVVMVPGRFHAERDDVVALNAALDAFRGVVVIVHSDEESLFPVNDLSHPNMRLWVMTPRPDRTYPSGTRFLGEGWSPYTPEILSAWGPHRRAVDVGFAGQVTHRRREEMMSAFEHSDLDYDLYPTPGFTQGLPRSEYLRQLLRTKVALCPSGPATQDSFRVFEALEAGCVPLVDDVTPDGREGYWNFMLGKNFTPFPLVRDWADGPELARRVLADFDEIQRNCQRWWAGYQQRLVDQLRADVAAVRG